MLPTLSLTRCFFESTTIVPYNRPITAQRMDLGSISSNDLAKLCQTLHSAEAWNEFVRRFSLPISLAVVRTMRQRGIFSPPVADDLVQEVFLNLFKDNGRVLRNFVAQEEDSIIGFLKKIAENITRDHFRSEQRHKRGGLLRRVEDEQQGMDALVADYGRMSAVERSLVVADVDRVLQRLTPLPLTARDLNIFWLFHRNGLTAREIGSIAALGLTVKGVESSLHRSITQIREQLKGGHTQDFGRSANPSPASLPRENRS